MERKSKIINWNSQLEQLEEYCLSKNWNIEYKKGRDKDKKLDFTSVSENLIVLKKNRHPEITFYVMLHEIGHMMLCQNRKMYRERFNAVFDDFSRGSLTHKVKTVEEELDAWKIGFKLAKRLKLYVNRRKFETVKARCISTYLIWAVEQKMKKETKTNGTVIAIGDGK